MIRSGDLMVALYQKLNGVRIDPVAEDRVSSVKSLYEKLTELEKKKLIWKVHPTPQMHWQKNTIYALNIRRQLI